FSGDVRSLVSEANSMKIPNPHIVIAATPDDLPMGMALALIRKRPGQIWTIRGAIRWKRINALRQKFYRRFQGSSWI
ncbi:MAG: hypothetical protein EBW84_02370, partial [Betaproteobacteria bacterium]|nr:hypothetical protein [Betaproteobacteria bacterium]